MLTIEQDLKSTTADEVLEELVALAGISDLSVLNALIEREQLFSTGIGEGVAVPHARHKDVQNSIYVVGISKKGIDFKAMDGKLVFVFFMVLAPKHVNHLQDLANVSKLARSSKLIEKIKTGTKQEIEDIWNDAQKP